MLRDVKYRSMFNDLSFGSPTAVYTAPSAEYGKLDGQSVAFLATVADLKQSDPCDEAQQGNEVAISLLALVWCKALISQRS